MWRGCFAAVAMAVALVATTATRDGVAAPREWIGDAACGQCHPAELASWRASRHAATAARLSATPAKRCLSCHGTGEAPVGWSRPGVGCESCHGAGAAYASDDVMRDRTLAVALGLRPLDDAGERARVCAGCHRGGARRTGVDLAAPVHSTPR